MGYVPRLRDGKSLRGGESLDMLTTSQRVIGNLNVCHSEARHIGGDEMNYYCEKINGAGGSWA